MPKKKHYVISESKLHEEVKNKLFTTYKPIELPVYEDLTPQWHGKKIPFAMWQEILAFMKHSYDVLKSETMCFLYYDEKKKQPWSFWVPPQITSGMTVKSDPDHINFQAQRAQYPDTMFGTVHHHCGTSAFQSGTDEADETNREGFHFTVGHLDTPHNVDIHFRWCLDNQCHELDDLSVAIGGAESPFKDDVELTADMHELEIEYMNAQFAIIPDLSKYDYTEYMDNVSKPKYAPKTYKAKSPYQSYWSDWGDMQVKKTTEDIILDNADIADEILFNLKLDFDAEELITTYYRKFESKDSSKLIMDLASGKTDDEEYARVIHAMLTDSVFLATTEGSYFYKLFSEQLDTCKKTGYRVTENDILQELEKLSVHDYRETL
jgi:hypothetical protein